MEGPAEVMTRSNGSPRIADQVVASYRRTELAGPDLSGFSGATASGEVWYLSRRALIVDHPNATGIQR